MNDNENLKELREKLGAVSAKIERAKQEHATLASNRGGRKSTLADILAVIIIAAVVIYRNSNGGVWDAISILAVCAVAALVVYSFILKMRSGKELRALETNTAKLIETEHMLTMQIKELERSCGKGDDML